jgi:hypothetical protein
MSFFDTLWTLSDEDGEIERAIPHRAWNVPAEIRADGRLLSWRALEGRSMHAGAGMLEEFVALADADPEAIAAYAQKWGVLGLCRRHHRPMTGLVGPLHGRSRDHLQCGFERENAEPLSAWRRLAALMRAVLRLADALEDAAALREPERWNGLGPSTGTNDRLRETATPASVDELLRRVVGRLLAVANVGIAPDWTPRGGLVTGGYGLLGALALELAAVVSGTRAFAMCSSCSRPFRPARRPPAGKRRYCPDCQARHQDRRDAQADWRRRRIYLTARRE